MKESEAKAYIEYLCESLKHFGAMKFDDKTISEYMEENRRVSEYLLALRKKRGEPEENDNGSEPTLIKTLLSFMKFMDTLNKYLIKVEGLDAEIIKTIEPDAALDRYVKGMEARIAMAKAPNPEQVKEKEPEKEETAGFGNFWDTKKTIDEKKAEEARREAEEEKAESEKISLALSKPMGGRRKSGWSVGGEAVKEQEDEVKKAEPENRESDGWKDAETGEVPFSDDETCLNKKKTDDEDNKPRPRRKTKWER
jgi:hypothetical protein